MKNGTAAQKWIGWILAGISLAVFALTALPNAQASEDLAMVRMFEPDEAAPLPHVLGMLAEAESLEQSLRNFLFYGYYFYGFPFFSFSALTLLPLKLAGMLDNLPLVMLMLRQLVSVLPMLAGLLLLVYLQDGWRTYRSVVLYVFLLSVPAVLANHFWWHVDSLVFLLVMLVIYCLVRDDLKFGKCFYIAAALIGCATAAKLVGLYFFLAIAVLLLMGFLQRKICLKQLIGSSLLFLLIMALAFLISNPFLISYWARQEYQMTFSKQMALLSQGYGVVYEKGLPQAWPSMRMYYGEAVFLLASLILSARAAFKGPNARLNLILLAWFLPLTISVVGFTHFKYQYWLPVALPVFSSFYTLLPEKIDLKTNKQKWWNTAAAGLALLTVLGQFMLNLRADLAAYRARLTRAQDNPTIQFYFDAQQALEEEGLAQPALRVYYDYRLYVPETQDWESETSYELLSYNYIEQKDFDILLLQEQRILDYLDPQAKGIDAQQFANSRAFYQDALEGQVRGYRLIFENAIGRVFVKVDQQPN